MRVIAVKTLKEFREAADQGHFEGPEKPGISPFGRSRQQQRDLHKNDPVCVSLKQ